MALPSRTQSFPGGVRAVISSSRLFLGSSVPEDVWLPPSRHGSSCHTRLLFYQDSRTWKWQPI